MNARNILMVVLIAVCAVLMLLARPARAAEPVKRQTITIDGKVHELFTPEELKERGLPYREIEPEKNAATWYLRAFEKYDSTIYRQGEPLWAQMDHAVKFGWTGPMPELSAHLKANAEAIELLRKAAALPDYQFPIIYTDFIMQIQISHLSQFREGARLLSYDAMRLARAGRLDEAIDSCLAGLTVGSHVAQDSFLIGGLVGIACEAISLQPLATLVQRYSLTEKQLDRIATFLKEYDKRRPDFQRIFASERPVAALGIKELFQGKGGGVLHIGDLYAFRPPDAAKDPFDEWLRKFVDSTGGHRALRVILPDRAILKHGNACFDKAQAMADMPAWQAIEARDSKTAFLADVPVWDTLTTMTAPILTSVRTSFAQMDAQLELMRTLVAVHLYAKRHGGQFPAELKDLVPKELAAVPVDSFNRKGEPLVYRREGDGFLLYCFFQNLKDDGGKLGTWNEKDTDFGYRFPPEPPPALPEAGPE